jgi:acyl CoA:acetate/3-ketoacid CoA transferase beta subunit
MSDVTRAEVCAVAVADALRGDGEILVSCFGTVPSVGARLARASFEPDLLMTDGICSLVGNILPVSGDQKPEPVIEGWLPFRSIFDHLWNGRRHVFMMANQIDRYGNQNFACIGDHAKPKVQLLGMRGAPGNTLSHTTSYWIPSHSPQVFVEKVDVVSGVGYDRARELGPQTSRFHEIRRIVSNLAVLDFETPDNRMRLRSVHPGVTVDEVVEKTGFELAVDGEVPESRVPSSDEIQLIREAIDPEGFLNKEVRV